MTYDLFGGTLNLAQSNPICGNVMMMMMMIINMISWVVCFILASFITH